MPQSKNKAKQGIIYILTNITMPGYIKIGKTTTSVVQRILELSRTSVPLPFECFYAARVHDMNLVESSLHDAFGDHRINPKREFFKIAPERVVAMLRLLAIEEVTPSANAGVESKIDAVAIEDAKERRSAFNFKMVNIPVGAELAFVRDENITCKVATDQKHVEFQGSLMSVSSAAQKALGSKWQVQGPAYWTYEGEILDEIRLRMEEGVPNDEEIETAGDLWIQQEIDTEKGK